MDRETNVYQTPNSDAEPDPMLQAERFTCSIYTGPSHCDSGKGAKWVAEGFALFKAFPGQWIATMVIGFLIVIFVQLIPVLGPLVSCLTTFTWSAGLVLGCHAIRQGKDFSLSYLFAAFKTHWAPLTLLAFYYSVLSLTIMVCAIGIDYASLIVIGAIDLVIFSPVFWLRALIGLAVLLPIMMCVWFAPSLIVIHNMKITTAIKESFKGCSKNVLPFLVNSLVLLLLFILAAIPLGLGLLVVLPVFMGSIYASYEDIFTSKKQDVLQANEF